MSEGNSLVADTPQDGDGPGPLTSGNGDYGWMQGIGIAESAMDAFNGIKDGNWIEGGLGVLGLAAEGAAAAIDPFGWLMSSVASFLMEHIQPLKDMLDSVCGDPPVIQSYSETWANVASHLEETQVTFANAVKNGTTGWTGEAADAYRASCKEQEESLAGAATTANAISIVVMIFGEVVAFVRETVRDLIADLVGKLISWVLETVFSLGFGTPVVVAQAVAAIGKWATKIADLLKKLTDSIRRVSPLLGKLADVFGSIMKVCGKIVGKFTGLDVIDTKNIIDGGFVQRLGRGGDGPDLGGSGSSGGGSNGGSGSDGGSGRSGSDGDSGDSGSRGGDSSGDGPDSGGEGTPSNTTPRSDRPSSGDGSSSGRGPDSSSNDTGTDGDSTPRPTSDSPSPRGNTGDSGSPSASPGSSGGPRGADGDTPSTLRSDTPNTAGVDESAGGRKWPPDERLPEHRELAELVAVASEHGSLAVLVSRPVLAAELGAPFASRAPDVVQPVTRLLGSALGSGRSVGAVHAGSLDAEQPGRPRRRRVAAYGRSGAAALAGRHTAAHTESPVARSGAHGCGSASAERSAAHRQHHDEWAGDVAVVSLGDADRAEDGRVLPDAATNSRRWSVHTELAPADGGWVGASRGRDLAGG